MSDLRIPDLNQTIIAGRLTRDPEMKYTQGNRAFCQFRIANTRYYKTRDGERKEETTFVNCKAWDKQAEWITDKLRKGRPVLVQGNLTSYEAKEGGGMRLSLNAQRVTPLDWDSDRETTNQPQRSESAPVALRPIEEPIPQDDIPF
jgi:single-strand DNA-binding protein